jgi:hypothetical protein
VTAHGRHRKGKTNPWRPVFLYLKPVGQDPIPFTLRFARWRSEMNFETGTLRVHFDRDTHWDDLWDRPNPPPWGEYTVSGIDLNGEPLFEIGLNNVIWHGDIIHLERPA